MPLLLSESKGGRDKRPEDSSSDSGDDSSSIGSASTVNTSNEKGSVGMPFKLLIVGGGPAGYSILVRALRLGMLAELCAAAKDESSAGVCLLESGESERLGGGRLQDYLLNSNTHAHKFYTHVMEQQPANLPPETVTGTALARLAVDTSSAGSALREMQNKEAPLALVGSWLCDVAKRVGEAVKQFPSSSSCLSGMRVVKIQRCTRPSPPSLPPSKTSTPTEPAVTTEATIETAPELLWRVTAQDGEGTEREFYTQNITLATGGRQDLPVLPSALHAAKLFASDRVCTQEGIDEVRQKLQRAPKKQQRIVIVGGSHSAFSAAWMCLHRLQDCTTSESPTGDVAANSTCGLGGASSICILHRSAIRVFYASKREAEADGYDNFSTVHRSTGQVHPFGGLRADAKDLWQKVRRGKEPRVRLLKATVQQSIAQKLFDDAAVIIWACGYSTNTVDVLDEAGLRISLHMFRGQVEVDDEARILQDSPASSSPPSSSTRSQVQPQLQPVPVGNLYGIGLGFGLKATVDGNKEELDGSSGRADGVAVYLKHGATLVLASVLGHKVFGSVGDRQLQSWEERALALRKGDDDGPGGDGPGSPLSPLRSPTGPTMLAATSPILRRVASASGGVVSRGERVEQHNKSSPSSFPPIVSRSGTANGAGTGSGDRKIARAIHENSGKRALVGELLGAYNTSTSVKKDTIYLDQDRITAVVDRLSKPRQQKDGSVLVPANLKQPFSPIAPRAQSIEDGQFVFSRIVSPLKTRRSSPVHTKLGAKSKPVPTPLTLPGLKAGTLSAF